MKEKIVKIQTRDGVMETFVTHPEEDGPFPAVVIYMDVWGVREELHDIARRVGTVGYYCILPDLYYRQGTIRLDFRNERNQAMSSRLLSGEDRRRVIEIRDRLTNAMVMADTVSLLQFVRNGEPVRAGPLGVIGYCMGGRHALCAAGHYPEDFRATASLHGTDMISGREDSPHLLVRKFRGELYCGFGGNDANTPPQMIRELEGLLHDCAVVYKYQVHSGAEHGYALPDRDVYDKQAANRDWEHIFVMFGRQLGGP